MLNKEEDNPYKNCIICNTRCIPGFILQKGSCILFFCNINCYKIYISKKSLT